MGRVKSGRFRGLTGYELPKDRHTDLHAKEKATVHCRPTKDKVEKTSETKADSFHLGGDHSMTTKSTSSRRRPLAKEMSRRRPLAKLRIILGGDHW